MSGERLLVSGVSVLDGAGAPPTAPTDVLVEGDRIAAIGGDLDGADAKRLDGGGRYLIPGLWETEAHLVRYSNGVPADMLLEWPREGDPRRLRANLRSYLGCGVTTIVDLGGPTEVLAELRDEQRRGEAEGARVLFVGRQFTAVEGQPVMQGRTLPGLTLQVSDPDSARRAATEMIERHGVDGLKANYTVGGGPFGGAPILSRAILEALVETAHASGLPVLVHIDDAEAAADALEAGVDNVEHMFFPEPGRFERDVERVSSLCLEAGAFWPMTIALWEAFSRAGDEQYLTEVGVEGKVEPLILEEIRGRPESLWSSSTEEWREYFRARYDASMSVVADVAAQGVRMTVATDAGNPMVFHGPSALREMELMQRAGMAPLDILRIATLSAAEKFARSEQLGTVAVGKVADLVLLEADPAEDIANVREIAAVIQGGEVLQPEALKP